MTQRNETALPLGVGVGYTIATGRLFCDVSEFHRVSEQLLGRPVWTHEFGDNEVWAALRDACEHQLTIEFKKERENEEKRG